jgi:hypothetical protein
MADEELIEITEAEETAEDRDLIDDLIDALNAGVTDVTFSRDALETNRPEAWGAVELTGDDNCDWADGGMTDQEVGADLWVCTPDRGSRPKRQVQKVLREFSAAHDMGWRFRTRNWLYDLEKVMYRWTLYLWCPLGEDPEPAVPATESDDMTEGSEEETLEDPEWPEMDQEE